METKIYYMNHKYIDLDNIDQTFFDTHYDLVQTSSYYTHNLNSDKQIFRYLERIYSKYNSKNNPLYGVLNLSHTSMSVGDIIMLGDKVYCVTSFSFKYLFDYKN